MNTTVGTIPMDAVLTMLNSLSRHDRKWLVEQMSAQVEREEAEADARWKEMFSKHEFVSWEEEDNAKLEAALAKFHEDWGGDGDGVDIVARLRKNKVHIC